LRKRAEKKPCTLSKAGQERIAGRGRTKRVRMQEEIVGRTGEEKGWWLGEGRREKGGGWEKGGGLWWWGGRVVMFDVLKL
jgi:hypothetical protein